jgi:hypothetical protein
MRKDAFIIPRGDDHDVYLTVDDLGRMGRIWREADVEATDFETVVTDLFEGQYKTRSAFSVSMASKVGRRTSRKISPKSYAVADVPSSIQDFVKRHEGQMFRQFSPRLVSP